MAVMTSLDRCVGDRIRKSSHTGKWMTKPSSKCEGKRMEKRRQRAESVKPYTNLERDSQRAKKWQRLWHLWRSLASVLFIVLLAFLWGSAWLLIGYCAFSLATYHLLLYGRSEERRVGKECRSRWSAYH